jgi:hypothetical protein
MRRIKLVLAVVAAMAMMLVASVAPAMANDNNDFRFNDNHFNDFRFHDFNDDNDFIFFDGFRFDHDLLFDDCGFDWDGPVTPLDCND